MEYALSIQLHQKHRVREGVALSRAVRTLNQQTLAGLNSIGNLALS